MRYLGIDFGEKRVGIALSDERGEFALPHGVLLNNEKLMQEMLQIIKTEKVEAVVCGESKDLSGRKNATFALAERFMGSLKKSIPIPVYFEPEFFTSAEASRIQGEGVNFDASAAALILKSFLNKKMNDTPSQVVPSVPAPSEPATPAYISIDDFAKVEMRAGRILTAEKMEKSDKLLKLSVDFGEASPRQVLSGIAKYFPDTTTLVGKTCMFVTNLEPRMMMGLQSQAMILAVSTTDNGGFSLLEPNSSIPPGTKAK